MTCPELRGPVDTVRQINENRGCPYTMEKATEMSDVSIDAMDANARKQEYYLLLDSVVPEVIEVARGYRERYPGGIVTRNEAGEVVSGLEAMKAKTEPHARAGNFSAASYWVHNAISETFNIAAAEWFAGRDKTAPDIQRINQLVGDPYKDTYGENAIEAAVASAANQTVFISAGFQRMTHDQSVAAGRDLTPADMRRHHDDNLKFAMPLTNLHFTETGNIIALLEPDSEPGGVTQVYANDRYFTHNGNTLFATGSALPDDLAEQFPGTFPDQRIGCPGAKFVPEIWSWIGDLTQEYANPALTPQEYNFSVPRSLPKL